MRAERQSVPEEKVDRKRTAVNLLVRAAQARDAHLAGDGRALASLLQELKTINASQMQRPKMQCKPLDRYVE